MNRWMMHHKSLNVCEMLSLLTLQSTPAYMKINHPPDADKSMTVLPFFLLNGVPGSSSTLTSLLPRLSGPVWPGPPPFPASSILPRASGCDLREHLSSFLFQPTLRLPSAPLAHSSVSNSVFQKTFLCSHFYDAQGSSGSIAQ